ncbi:MAG TPA: type III pantothenate kinase [Acidothermaceae bacterium]|jgi:type III pantothenate kinase|nr:type III pantothenate kinase [Acidothermaceae bacterium]
MLLAIDVGNTQTVLGLFDGEKLVEHWRLATEPRRTADELALLVNGLLDSSGHRDAVAGISACSTVPRVLNEVRAMCERWFSDLPVVIVEPGIRTGVPVLTDNPKEVGSDRIMNTLAAYTLHGGPAVVVDFGTSTNFDVVSERGEFLGGALAPGIEISVDALASRAAQLLKVQLVRPRSVIGKNTVEALQSGILYGFAAQIDGIAERIVAELGPSTTVIATGGLATVVLEECRHIDVHEPWLTLIGLRLVFERNVS